MNHQDPKRAWLGGISLLLATIPVVFFAILLAGGGRGGFEAWNDVGTLLVLMVTCAVVGLVLVGLSAWRGERSRIRWLAAIVHVIYLFMVAWVFTQ